MVKDQSVNVVEPSNVLEDVFDSKESGSRTVKQTMNGVNTYEIYKYFRAPQLF
jgi:hypothetical protein